MKKIYNRWWIICLAFMSLCTCSKDDDQQVFSNTPADRVAQANQELLNLLVSQQQGYKGVYFTKNDEFGGFTFYMKFNSDGTVEMTSDFDNETAVVSSDYEVRLGTSASELVFTTRNHIQKLSNPSYRPLIATGFKGTSVFQYFSNENNIITFRDVRNRNSGKMVLTPTNFSDFETESVASVTKSLASRSNFTNPNVVTSFPFMSVENGGDLTKYALNYDNVRLFANPTTQASDGTVSDLKFGIAFTEDGLTISPALDINGTSIENFTFDNTSGFEYVAVQGGVTAKIGYGNVPVTPLDAYEFGVRRNRAWLNREEPEKSSGAFNIFYNNFNQSLIDTYGFNLRFILFRSLNDGAQPYIHIFTTIGAFWYDVDFTITNGIVVFTRTGATNAPPIVTTILKPLLDTLLGGSSGFYLNKTGGLQNFSNRTFSMINVADPRIEINYWDQ